MLFAMTYGVAWKRKRNAKQMIQKNGTYQFCIQNGILIAGAVRLDLKKSRVKVIHSTLVYVVQVDRDVFILPKRIMDTEQQIVFEQTMKPYTKCFIFVQYQTSHKKVDI